MCNYKIFSIAPTEQKKKWRFKKTRRRELEIRKRTIIQEAAQEAVTQDGSSRAGLGHMLTWVRQRVNPTKINVRSVMNNKNRSGCR